MRKAVAIVIAALSLGLVCPAQEITPGKQVDLGLSVDWAGWNIGAEAPEDAGGYYAWGEVEEKEVYTIETYKYCNGSYNTLTKYCVDEAWGQKDGRTRLEPEDDVASVKWGDGWRMPTREEMNELFEKCTWIGCRYNNMAGYRIVGPNGNSIFLPCAGDKYDRKRYVYDRNGVYWTASIDHIDPQNASGMYMHSTAKYKNQALLRDFGHTVRAVHDK